MFHHRFHSLRNVLQAIKYTLGLTILSLSIVGCQKDSCSESQQISYEMSNEAKHVIAVVPVIDNTNNDFAWSLSDEFTSFVYHRLSQAGMLQLHPVPKVRAAVKKLKNNQNPFGIHTNWLKQAFQTEEFVVFLELVKHEEILKTSRKKEVSPANCSADLNMSMRVRIFDLRGEEPVVILQELINDTHLIPRQFTQANFNQVSWGDENFGYSPLGLAHLEFTKEISTRIEDYINLAIKSRPLLN